MKESNSLVSDVTNNFQQKNVMLNTKGQFMKKSNTLADNVANYFL